MNDFMQLSFLSKYRTFFMGFAIFWIFFYHQGVGVPGLNILFSVGWIGVEIFFLLSGFGLSASLDRNPDFFQFYKRRLKRILPTWWLILFFMHVLGLSLGIKTPHNLWECIQWYTGLGWWINGIYYEWYMPTLIVFYLMSPLVNKLTTNGIMLGMALSVIIGVLLHELKILEHVYMSYQRIPVFLMGFFLYKKYKEGGIKIKKVHLFASIIIGLFTFIYAYKFKNTDIILSLELRRYALLLFLLPFLYLVFIIPRFFKRYRVLNYVGILSEHLFCFLGVISMEIYLLHINHNYSVIVTNYLNNYIGMSFVSIVWFFIVIVCSFIIKKMLEKANVNQIFFRR